MDTEKITWKDIKELANSLNEAQLNEPVRWWKEECGGTVVKANTLFEEARHSDRYGGVIDVANTLPEDYVSDGEGYSPRSDLPEENIDEDEPVLPEGTPMLWLDI